MVKNLLATVGLAVVLKKGYGLYCTYRQMEQENAFWRKAWKAEP